MIQLPGITSFLRSLARLLSAAAWYRFSLILGLCLVSAYLSAQVSEPIIESSILFTKEDGLRSNVIRAISEDDDGFIWLGTGDGLVRFDGSTFKHYLHDPQDSTSLYDNRVSAVTTSEDYIWVGTHLGFSVMDRKTERFRNYQFEHFKAREPLSKRVSTRVGSIVEARNGDVWLGTFSDAVFRYNPARDSFVCYRFPQDVVAERFPAKERIDHILSIHQDHFDDRFIWVGTTAGLLKINAETDQVEWYVYPKKEERDFLSQNAIRRIYQHDDGLLYISSWHAKVNIFDPQTESFYLLPLENASQEERTAGYDFLNTPVGGIFRKSANQLFIWSLEGLMTYDISRKSWTRIQYNDLDDNIYYGISLIDSQNRTWFCTSAGLRLYDPLQQQFVEYDYADLHPGRRGFSSGFLHPVPNGDLTVVPSATDGFFTLDLRTGNWEKFALPEFEGQYESGFGARGLALSPTGSWTVASHLGLFDFDPLKQQLRPVPMPSGWKDFSFRAAIWDESDQLWLGTENNGLLKWVPATNSWKQYKAELEPGNPSIPTSKINHLLADKNGNIWLQREGGFSAYDARRDTFYNFLWSQDTTNSVVYVHTIAGDDTSDKVWINGSAGILGYALADQPELGIVQKYDYMQSHQLRVFTALQVDEYGMLWALAEDKLIRIDPNAVSDITTYDLRYGVREYDDIYGFAVLDDDRLVIGGRNKVWVGYQHQLRKNDEKPQPYISGISVLQEPWDAPVPLQHLEQLNLDYQKNFFSFDFAALGFSRGMDTRFRYRLTPFEENWTEAKERRFANFTNVPPGDYVFELQAANNDGLWNEERYKLPVQIATPWWQTTWFWLLSSILILGLAYLVYRWRIRQVRREERLRADYERKLADIEMSALRAQMNPHFIFNSLNSIEYYIISNEPEKASDYLNRFSRLIRLILQNSKNNIIPLKDDLETLQLYIEIESVRFDHQFDYEIKIEEGIDTTKVFIPPMLLQPYVENAIWHGLMQKQTPGGKIELKIRRQGAALICLLEDNGIGRAAAAALKSKSGSSKKSFGMKITSERLKALNHLADTRASVQIFDLTDEEGKASGTRVELVIPL